MRLQIATFIITWATLFSLQVAAFPLDMPFKRAPYSVVNVNGNPTQSVCTTTVVTQLQTVTQSQIFTTTIEQIVYVTMTASPSTATATTTVTTTLSPDPMSTSVYDNGFWHPSSYYTEFPITQTSSPTTTPAS
jgi:hypothetical protein